MSKQSKYSPEVRDRAIRMVFECEKDQLAKARNNRFGRMSGSY